jgi:hypothetical protein
VRFGKYIIKRGRPVYAHPFHDGWHPNRLDMGADGTFRRHIYAPFKGRVIYAGDFSGWNGSKGIIIEARRSNNRYLRAGVPTARLYFTEGVEPVLRTGQHFRAGQKIARAANSPYGDSYGYGALGAIEWGVSARGPEGLQANAYASELGLGSAAARHMVLDFRDWFVSELHISPPTETSNAGSA